MRPQAVEVGKYVNTGFTKRLVLEKAVCKICGKEIVRLGPAHDVPADVWIHSQFFTHRIRTTSHSGRPKAT